MKVAHLCLSCFYIDGFGYQENELIRQHVLDGHEVMVIASTETYSSDQTLNYLEPSSYKGSEGAHVVRLPYRKLLPHAFMRKLRMHPGVYETLRKFAPDAILFHGLCGWELLAAARYKQENPHTLLYVDSHEDHNNSARSFLSKHVLHKLYYAWIIQRCMKSFNKILCISLDTIEFVKKTYGVPTEFVEFFPLGGRIHNDVEYAQRRLRGRQALRVLDHQIVLMQTGKMGHRKKVLESLDAFSRVKGDNLRYVLAGSLSTEIRTDALLKVAADPRISFLGWKTTEELQDLLCAADVYVQPGTQSVTMQMSLCARCPVILDDVLSHKPFVKGNGWVIQHDRQLDEIFTKIRDCSEMLCEMSIESKRIAEKWLDYKVLAARILK